MKLNKLYIERLGGLSDTIREEVIGESPHTQIVGEIPPGLEILRGAFVDLGFENLGLDDDTKRAIYLSFVGRGVALPGTGFKLRYTQTGVAVVEPDDGVLALPDYWREAVLVLNGNEIVYAGKRVRRDQLGRD